MTTIKEVENHFKNVKEIRSLYNGEIHEIDLSRISENNIGYTCNSKSEPVKVFLYHEKGGFAEIVSYKEDFNKLTDKEVVHAFENPQYLKDMFPKAFEQEKSNIDVALFELYQLQDHYKTMQDKDYFLNKIDKIIKTLKNE